jgi:monoterpene epsilon-lactone hydrolase
MNALPVPAGIRVHETSLGGRPALRISPDAAAGAGILLYLHGGSHVVGSPWTALGLAAGLMIRTGMPGISGGGLTIAGALAARDAGLPRPAAIVAFSPGLDATRAGQDRGNPLLSPVVAADLTGLPPVLVQVGTNEMLLDDARRLALRASDAEVDVVLDITAKVPHVFQSFTGVLDEAGEALDRAALFLRQRVRG